MTKGVLFDRWAANLATLQGEESANDVVLCPFCLRGFNRSALATKELTEEHIIPKSLGGKETVLSCKECNNSQGSRLDSQVEKAIAAEEALEGSGILRAEVEIANTIARGEVELDLKEGGTSQIHLSKKVSHPMELEAMADALRDGAREVNLKLTLGFVPDRFRLGLLRVGYLVLFSKLGYAYILSQALEPIRRQILEYDPPHKDLEFLITRVPGFGSMMNEPFAAFDLSSSVELNAFLVLLKFKNVEPHAYATVLPAPSQDPGDVFGNLRSVAELLSRRGLRVQAW